MGTSVQLTPLSGAHSEGPLCYLLQVDNYRFLLDCGWTDSFDVTTLQPLASVASTIDAVLLSHPDTLHLGALPYAVGKLGLCAPVYCTHPVHMMGQMYMYDHYLSRRAVSNFDVFNLDDVDKAFLKETTIQLKYSQHLPLSGKGEGIAITPYAAGHLLGGTIWKITKDTEDIIYAVDFNHRKERHLSGTVLEMFIRPAVLVTDAYNALNSQPSRRQRDQEFIDVILRVLRADGNVLLPVEAAGRVLELILHLEQHWTQHRLSYPMALLTYVSYSTIEFAKSLLEWMSDSIAKTFEHTRDNAFLLKCLKLCNSRKEFDELPPGPKVVFASAASLEAGFARDLFIEWAPDPRNLILFTERGQLGTLARLLQSEPPPKVVKVTISKKVALTGDELRAYEEERIRIKEEEEEEARKASFAAEEATDVVAAAAGDVSTSETVLAESGGSQSVPEGSGVPVVAPLHRNVLIDGFVPSEDTVDPMFPLYENNNEWDEYGEVINPDDFVMKENETEHMLLQAASGHGEAGEKSLQSGDTMADTPSKVVINDLTVQVRCSLQYMDFEGRSDGRSIKSILAHVAPLKLVLVHGSAESTEHLRQHCLKNVCTFVYAPRIGESVDATSDLSAYKVRLSERLMSTVLFKKLGDYELAWVDGEVGSQEEDMLPLLPISGVPPPHKAVFVGDLRLADFKQLLAAKGIQAEFTGGVLRCGDNIAVRKSGSQQLVIEGPLSDDYYTIRELLYSQYYVL